MKKVKLGPETYVYPKPAFLVGSKVDNNPNFMAAAWSGIVNSEPPMISVSIRPQRYTLKGIEQNGTFSVNVPSESQMVETDYCGIYSGHREDKNQVCGFTVFYGKLKTAPLIEEFPINIECKVVHEQKLGTHIMFIGQIEEIHASEDVLTNGLPDVRKIKPIIYTTGVERVYYGLGSNLGPAHRVGMQLKESEK
ncbi:MAG TPA: flavin reductase family protein [Deltaproteobacteria bacterium]|nr:flavin reductase family protein [Deltaproteobacteria bacterium]